MCSRTNLFVVSHSAAVKQQVHSFHHVACKNLAHFIRFPATCLQAGRWVRVRMRVRDPEELITKLAQELVNNFVK